MKMTLELSSDLVREMKLRAVHEGRKLKDVADAIVRRGLKPPAPPSKAIRQRIKLPLVVCAKNSRASLMTVEQLVALEHETFLRDDLERAGPPV